MLYKRILITLCFAAFLSVATTKSSTNTQASFSLKSAFDKVLSYTDPIASKIGFNNTASFVKVSTFLLILIPLVKYLTDGKKFNAASSDEELNEAVKTVKQKITLRSLRALSKELMYKLVRMLRSKLGHRQYLITIKNEKTKNSDGSTTSVEELKTVSGTGWCKNVEDAYEHLVFIINSAIGLSLIQKLAISIESNNFVEDATKLNPKLHSPH